MPHTELHLVLGSFGKKRLPDKLADVCQLIQQHSIDADWATAITPPKSTRARIEQLLPGVPLRHHGDLAGDDSFICADDLWVLGGPFPKPADTARRASCTHGVVIPAQKPVPTPCTITKQDGSGVTFDRLGYTDPRLQAAHDVVYLSGEIQALGRCRPFNRTTADPARAFLLANAPVPFPVTTITRWQRPSRAVKMAATGMVLMNRARMAQIHPELFPTEKAAGHALWRWGGIAGLEALIRPIAAAQRQPWLRAIYQLEGQGHKPEAALVGKDHVRALRRLLGPLVSWQIEPFTPGTAEKTAPVPGKDIGDGLLPPVLGPSSPADPASMSPEIAQPPPRPPPDG